MKRILICDAQLVNEGTIQTADVYIKDGFIHQIGSDLRNKPHDVLIESEGKYLLPGFIDDQVHFREPGLTHKATIKTEARAAVAGGVTTYMEMPNTKPGAVTIERLEEKYAIGTRDSLANFSFYMGTTNDNLAEVLKVDPEWVCGVKIFMGSSTGNMLVDDQKTLEGFFSEVNMLIATHCEDTPTILANEAKFREQYGEEVPIELHPEIRSAEACYLSSSFAVELAKQHGTRLHILHISTAKETQLFDNSLPLSEKKITAEACTHHLWFSQEDYAKKGTLIKWNPAVKTASDREAILQAVLDDRIDILATDHAPHTLEEKQNTYFKAPSGGPLVQHNLQAMFDLHKQGKISLEKIVEKACHNPAILFRIKERGFIHEGYWADLVLLDPSKPQRVSKENLHYQCGWSPFEGHTFAGTVTHTIVSGHIAYQNGQFDESVKGKRLQFNAE